MNVRNLLIALFIASCGAIAFQQTQAQDAKSVRESTTAPTTLPSVDVQIGTERFTLEIADDPAEQETGLMYRKAMAADHGMIFVFPWSDVRSFWMRNTLIPLDILYLDDDAVVLNVEPMVPLDESAVRSDGKARYAIELNAGTAKRIGIRRGDKVALPALGR
jgi:uncharacterized membrane protein (UPF0127 family)